MLPKEREPRLSDRRLRQKEKKVQKDPKPTKSKLHEAQSQVQQISTVAEEKLPVIQAINETILKYELKLDALRGLQTNFLKASLDVVEEARNELEALLSD